MVLCGSFPGWNTLGESLIGENFLGRSFPGGAFPRMEYINFILMKFCCKTEILMLQINTNLTVSIVELIINGNIT